MLTSILDSSPRRTPPTHSHTRGRNTSAPHVFCPWEERKKIHQSLLNYPLLHYYICIFYLFFWLPLSDFTSHSILWAFICFNVIHVFPARIISFTLSCTWRTNQKSNRYFTWSVWHHKHQPQSRFTAVARSQFTPDWQISLLREALAVALHLAHRAGQGLCAYTQWHSDPWKWPHWLLERFKKPLHISRLRT